MSPTRRFQVTLATALAAQVIVAVAMLSSRASGTDSALWGLPLDDGWIHLVYARNLISGFEVAFNPGEPEVGLTSPLWALLLSPLVALGGHGAALAAKLLALLAALATTALAGLLARRIAGDLAGAVAAALVAVDPLFAFAAVSGMEVTLASGLTLGSLLALSSRRPLTAGALLGAAALTRPEALALIPLLLLWGFSMVRSGELGRARALTGLTIAAAMLAPFVSLCLAVTGRPLPNTYYIKGDLASPASTSSRCCSRVS